MITTSVYYYKKELHTELATELNQLASSKNVQVSRWINNSKGRQIVTYIVHTGERNSFASKQENVMFKTSLDAGRGNRVQDEQGMMTEVRQFLNSITVDELETEIYINIDERYGDAYPVIIADYIELNPVGVFEERYDGIYEDGEQIAEVRNV